MADFNWVADTPENDIRINGYEGKCYRVYMQPKDNILLFAYLAARSLSVGVGILFQMDSILVDDEYLPRLKEIAEDLGIDILDETVMRNYLRAKATVNHG
jgi:hypothetical protein